ncbi:MAG: hypothetical protein ABQ298_10860 [Puniceicoccaceae bacterium]
MLKHHQDGRISSLASIRSTIRYPSEEIKEESKATYVIIASMAPTFDITDWQLFVYVLFSLFMLFSAWQGWLHGLGRSALMLAGVPIGYFIGKVLGFIILDLYRNLIPYPEPILIELTNLIFGVLVYFLFVAGAIFLFKSTRKQPTLKKKLISGIGGVLFGLCNGIVVFIVVAILIRVIGILNLAIPPAPGSLEHRQKQDVYLPEHVARSDKFVVNLYRALYHPPIEHWVKQGDPVPEARYELLMHLRILSVREDLRDAFLQLEQVQTLLQEPEIASVLEESTLPAQLQQGRFHDVMRHPDLRELYQKPTSAELLNRMQWGELTRSIIETSDLSNHPDL